MINSRHRTLRAAIQIHGPWTHHSWTYTAFNLPGRTHEPRTVLTIRSTRCKRQRIRTRKASAQETASYLHRICFTLRITHRLHPAPAPIKHPSRQQRLPDPRLRVASVAKIGRPSRASLSFAILISIFYFVFFFPGIPNRASTSCLPDPSRRNRLHSSSSSIQASKSVSRARREMYFPSRSRRRENYPKIARVHRSIPS
jgi:hypothetical protein